MQEVDVTPQLLIQFSTEYARVPCVNLNDENGFLKGIPFTHHILYHWISELAQNNNNDMYHVFTAWLCGKDKFLHPDKSLQEVTQALANAMSEVIGEPDDS